MNYRETRDELYENLSLYEKLDEMIFKHYNEELNIQEQQNENSCCNRMLLINDNNTIVCSYCGQISDYLYVNEGINFYEDMFRIRRKSQYNRDFLFSILDENRKQLDHEIIEEFNHLFRLVELSFLKLYPNRRRLIKFHFLFHKILQYMEVDLCYLFEKKLPEATLKKYNETWDKIHP